MSHLVECQTELRDPQALVAALAECGFLEDPIQVHDQPVPLYGYRGDVRARKAHIVIRRQHVKSGARDVGWERQPDGTYRAQFSQFDTGVGPYAHRQAPTHLRRIDRFSSVSR